MVVAEGNKLGQLGIKTAVTLQRVTAHFSHGPVTFFKIMCDPALGAARDGVFQQGMVRNDGQTVIFTQHLTHKAGQERFDQRFRLGRFTILFAMDHGSNTIAVHHFLHLRRRNEVTFLCIDFKEAKAFFRGFYDPFSTWRLGMQLLFKLR